MDMQVYTTLSGNYDYVTTPSGREVTWLLHFIGGVFWTVLYIIIKYTHALLGVVSGDLINTTSISSVKINLQGPGPSHKV